MKEVIIFGGMIAARYDLVHSAENQGANAVYLYWYWVGGRFSSLVTLFGTYCFEALAHGSVGDRVGT